MNGELIALIVEKNSADIEAIVSKIGVPVLLSLLPNIVRIMGTLQKSSSVTEKAQVPGVRTV